MNIKTPDEVWLEYAEPVPRLLPCPFCGRKAELIRDEALDWYVTCEHCDIRLNHNGPHLAAQAWNTRVPAEEEKK